MNLIRYNEIPRNSHLDLSECFLDPSQYHDWLWAKSGTMKDESGQIHGVYEPIEPLVGHGFEAMNEGFESWDTFEDDLDF